MTFGRILLLISASLPSKVSPSILDLPVSWMNTGWLNELSHPVFIFFFFNKFSDNTCSNLHYQQVIGTRLFVPSHCLLVVLNGVVGRLYNFNLQTLVSERPSFVVHAFKPLCKLHHSFNISEQGRSVNSYYFKLIILKVLQLIIVYSY